ncbi:unnamed protein product, partial [Ilex paraguariensis]
SSLTKKVNDLDVEVSTSKDKTESVEDLQDSYNKLYGECKQKRSFHSLNMRLKSSEDDNKILHMDLVKSKTHICGLEKETKFLQEKVSFLESEHKGHLEYKKCLAFKFVKLDRDLHES